MYMIMFQSDGNTVYQKIEDKDTLWLVADAMLDGPMEMSITIDKIGKDDWYGKGESRHE